MLGKNKKRVLDEFRQKCRTQRLKMTPQRIAIYEELIKSCDHPCVEDVFSRVKTTFPDMSIDTVYRTINTFADIGMVNTVEGYGEAKRYDPDTKPHHHFRCKKCNRIVDFTNDSFDKLRVPDKIKGKYAVSDLKVLIEGLCDKCLGKK